MAGDEIARSQEEIEGQLNEITDEQANGQSQWPDRSYEQGVDNALRWVLGWSDSPPMTEEE